MQMLDIDNIAYSIGQISIIDDISFNAGKDEFVSIIGPSGCGKSTLLRIIAGLIKPSRGSIRYNGEEVTGPNSEISFVFQDFGLLPWLTNIENVKVGLSLLDISEEEKDKRAASIFKSMGLEGFENAYPNMLSGGMKQRVGIARAIISNPRVLLMDEPFSSLDELTAETLRTDIVDMLKSTDVPVSCVLMVTHNVEEAVELSSKIVILSQRPSAVKEVKDVEIAYPRNRHSNDFMDMVDYVYKVLTE
ncbi:MAG: ABC transporter ATP-binding protein [Candidatus Marsarchaeota archaeon]|jgi:NitT/TauT family transport system ATP-binding protein|nr:ABC transporter ATP-binding protein [Candidatus Marsarchaeota archaeon]MCL5418455.1 ABC transporter ATP-binding protein [Candidatus Marsarchaeota archaeon]